jgi:hypothetical protein
VARPTLTCAVLLCAVIGTARCGSGTAPAGGSTGSPPGDGGSGNGTDAGTGGGTDGGGNPDGGSGSDAGGGSGSDAGGGSGSDGGGGDSDGGSGTASDCNGVMPSSVGSPVTVALTPGSGEVCWNASSDQQGNVIVERHFDHPGAEVNWQVFAPTGAVRGSFQVPVGLRLGLWPVETGFQGVAAKGGPPSYFLTQWSPDGAKQRETFVGGDETGGVAFQSATGGTVVVSRGCHFAPGWYTLRRFDSTGVAAAAAQTFESPACDAGIAVGDLNGNILVVFWPGTFGDPRADPTVARWHASDGKALTPFFSIAPAAASSTLFLRPLIGGGAALQVDGVWTASFRSGVAAADAPPAWLAQNPQTDVKIIRNGTAYALIPKGSADRNVLRLYSAAGNSCGSVSFPTEGLAVGFDGTVIGAQGNAGCTHPFWPALLR